LLLGLGAGSAARVIRHLRPDAAIVGVELEREVIALARARFGLDELEIEVVEGEAQAFLVSESRCFDLVIDDLFYAAEGVLTKPPWVPAPGLALAADRLRPDGILVTDVVGDRRPFAAFLSERFESVLSVRLDDCDNEIMVASQRPLRSHDLRRRLAVHPALGDLRHNLQVRRLEPPI
jgi:spermidine synthase